jgi:hypothetical protein
VRPNASGTTIGLAGVARVLMAMYVQPADVPVRRSGNSGGCCDATQFGNDLGNLIPHRCARKLRTPPAIPKKIRPPRRGGKHVKLPEDFDIGIRNRGAAGSIGLGAGA